MFNKKILLYDYKTQSLLRKIDVVNLGDPTSYTIINQDTIIVLDYLKGGIAFLNDKGEIYEKIEIPLDIAYYPFPVSKIAPIKINKGKLVYWGNISGEYIDESSDNRKVMGILDLESHAISYQVPYSDVYKESNWGGGLFRWIYAEYNPKTHNFIVSFPAEHDLFVFSENGDMQNKIYAGSDYIDVIASLPKSKIFPLDAEEKTRFFVESHSYANIVYDPYRDLYYRVAEQKCNYKDAIGWKKNISIIILDSQFDKIGETLIGECDYNYRYAMFVNKQGLHIPQGSSENMLCFNIYSYEKKNIH